MRLVIQRVRSAQVIVDKQKISQIEQGLLIFLGIHRDDDGSEIEWLAKKVCGLRIFEDEKGKMNLSVIAVQGEILLVPQFTLYGNCEHGRRPDFTKAAPPEQAKQFYQSFATALSKNDCQPKLGKFGAHMQVKLDNDGPVTMILDR